MAATDENLPAPRVPGNGTHSVQTRHDRPTHLLMLDMLFEALRVGHALNALAIEICGRAVQRLVRRLVLEACGSKNSRAATGPAPCGRFVVNEWPVRSHATSMLQRPKEVNVLLTFVLA